MGYQLLQKYTDQIQKWGWICSITESSESFAKYCSITLLFISCMFTFYFVHVLFHACSYHVIRYNNRQILKSYSIRYSTLFPYTPLENTDKLTFTFLEVG